MVRKFAYECLKEILMKEAFSNLALKSLPETMSAKDKALTTQIVYGTLQYYDYLSYQWHSLTKKKVKKSLEILLNMSVYQLLFLERIPDYAVVSTACELVNEHERSFVQAILFECIRQGKKEIEIQDPIEHLALETSLPKWIVQLLISHYGQEEATKIAKSFLEQDHTLTARINPLKADIKKLHEDSDLYFFDEWAFCSKKNLLKSDYFKNGEIVIQDYSSQLAARFLNPQENEVVLDACSAPGTKTTYLAAMMNNRGEIIASDYYSHRLELVEEACQRLNVTIVKTKQMDATLAHTYFKKESFDRILLDVPCSGLGVLKHKPELKYRIKPEDLDSLLRVQKEILESCVQLLKVNGVMVYSTCTLNKKENDRQIKAFLKNHPEMVLQKEQTCFPYQAHQDGFYMARMLKKGETVLK